MRKIFLVTAAMIIGVTVLGFQDMQLGAENIEAVISNSMNGIPIDELKTFMNQEGLIGGKQSDRELYENTLVGWQVNSNGDEVIFIMNIKFLHNNITRKGNPVVFHKIYTDTGTAWFYDKGDAGWVRVAAAE